MLFFGLFMITVASALELLDGDAACIDSHELDSELPKVHLIQKKVEQYRAKVQSTASIQATEPISVIEWHGSVVTAAYPTTPPQPQENCADRWGVFGEEAFNRSQVTPSTHVMPKDFSNYSNLGGGYGSEIQRSGMFVFPENRFAFCAIAKTASTQWITIFAKMVFNDTSVDDKSMLADFPLASTAAMHAVFSDAGATTAVAVREPLSRFLSAFLNKCNNTASVECVMASDEIEAWDLSLRDAVEWMLSQDPRTLELHWLLQSEYCELRDRVQEFRYVLLYSKENFAADATCVMQLAGIERFNSMGPENNNEPFWTVMRRGCDGEEVEQIQLEPDATSCSADDEVEQLKLLFPQEVAKQLMAHLDQDYATFNIPKPSWIRHATGALYDTPLKDLATARAKLLEQ